MTLNADVFLKDLIDFTIPNDGVTEVFKPTNEQAWNVLRYELKSFVCDGEYEKGMERVLSTYLENLHQHKQPAVWVSGFYGSGKSHFVRVLEHLWQNQQFDDNVYARTLVQLPDNIRALFGRLDDTGNQAGGRWAASGKLSASGGSVRLALLTIIFSNADLPAKYAPARLVLWLHQNGYYAAVKAALEHKGRTLTYELNNMYVSQHLAEALLTAEPSLATNPADVRALLKTQYPDQHEISEDEMLQAIEDVLSFVSTKPGTLPLTLLIFDELQQFIGEDSQRTLVVQEIVEACSSRFGSSILFVATGQSEIQATTQLAKLQGRFTVRVTLSDKDVEQVVRQVVLQKKQDKINDIEAILEHASGEINRHLQGTKIVPGMHDNPDLVADYPLLPVRRRFWERMLRAIDSAGSAGQLRTQLRVVLEAVRAIINRPLGTVVAGDVIYQQLKPDMLQSGVLLRDIAELIEQQDDGTADGKLRSRLCATIFLIGKLPTDGPTATGLRATSDMLSDLLVEDLVQGSEHLRQRVPELLTQMVDNGTLMLIENEYRLQTRESAEWEQDYRQRRAKIISDDSRVASDRTSLLRKEVNAILKEVKLTHGESKEPRRIEIHYSLDAPTVTGDSIPVWVRDEWNNSPKTVREDAQAAGGDSPRIMVFLPRRNADALKNALAQYAAARETFETKAHPVTPEGIEARNAMKSRVDMEERQVQAYIKDVVLNAQVFLAGGREFAGSPLAEAIYQAGDAALVRLFPRFKDADHSKWGTVLKRAQEGNNDALTAIDYHGDVEKHPVCQEIRTYAGSNGRKGSELRNHFGGQPYGWPQDAIDGALVAMLASGHMSAKKGANPVAARSLVRAQIGTTDFYSEGITLTAGQRLQVRKLITDLGISVKTGEEAQQIPVMLERLRTLASAAGGDAPRPLSPDTSLLDNIAALSGNEQLLEVYNKRDELGDSYKHWNTRKEEIERRIPEWQQVERLLDHAKGLPVAQQVQPQVEAIRQNRTLLDNPNPLTPLLADLSEALREELQRLRKELLDVCSKELDALEASEDWQRLRTQQREQLYETIDIRRVPELQISSSKELLGTLDTYSLEWWQNQAMLFPSKVKQVREEVVKLLEPEVVQVHPPSRTLKTAEDVEQYLADLRTEMMSQIENGHPIVIL
jgi:hypothetical protein